MKEDFKFILSEWVKEDNNQWDDDTIYTAKKNKEGYIVTWSDNETFYEKETVRECIEEGSWIIIDFKQG